MCRQLVPWEVGREGLIIILIEAKKEVKRRKSPVLANLGFTYVLFGITPLSRNGIGQEQASVSGVAGHWMWWKHPLACIHIRFHL